MVASGKHYIVWLSLRRSLFEIQPEISVTTHIMSSHLPPPIAPPSGGIHSLQPEHTGQAYGHPQQAQAYPQAPLNGFPGSQNAYPQQPPPGSQNAYPQQPLQSQYVDRTPSPLKPGYAAHAPVVKQVFEISDHHSKDSHRLDNTYHPSLSPKQTTEALVESAVARHHTRADVLFLKAVWGGILLS